MNATSHTIARKPATLNDAIRELTGKPADFATALQIGPGAVYVLELPTRALRFLGPRDAAFPHSFYGLADSATKWDELVAAGDRESYLRSWHDDLQTPASYSIRTSKNGNLLPVQDYRAPLLDSDGRLVGVVGRILDDSFRATAMDALVRRSWKEIASALTRRFLHDFNNTIAGIYSLSELYAEPGSDAVSMTEAMGHIRSSATRAQELTKKIRQLTTLEDGETGYFNLESLVADQREYLAALLPKGADLGIKLSNRELPVHLDANRFRQALLHLASNACDAAGNDVAVTITLTPPLDSDRPNMARLEFADNGPGFKSADVDAVLAPFFTTKDPSKHPGLGLNIVKGFVEEIGGEIAVRSSETGGHITLYLPVLSSTSTDKAPASIASVHLASASKEPASSNKGPATPKPTLLVYSWEEIDRHPLIKSMQAAEWKLRIHLETTDFLIDLAQPPKQIDGLLFFKSALDEKAVPLLSELARARSCPPIAVIELGQGPEDLPEPVKSHCGLVVSGASKPKSLMSKLSKLYS